MDKLRPISLCNSFYKLISKVLTTRLLNILPLIISPQQTGFVPGRQILDSIVSVHEVIQSLEAGKKEGFLLKLICQKLMIGWTRIFSFLPFGLLALTLRFVSSSISLFPLLPFLSWSMASPPSSFLPRGVLDRETPSPLSFSLSWSNISADSSRGSYRKGVYRVSSLLWVL